MRGPRTRITTLTAALLVAACACTAGGPDAGDGAASTSSPPPTTPPPGSPPAGTTEQGGPADDPRAEVLDGQPSAAAVQRARQDVSELTVAELAGQVVVGVHDGTAPGNAADVVRRHGVAGVITFGHNVPEDAASRAPLLQAMSQAVQDAVTDSGRGWPALVGIDQEGGPVARLGAPATAFPSAMALGAAGDPALARRVATASGAELRALGYTMVFAPVADVTAGPQDPTIGVRAVGSDPEQVTDIVTALTQGYLEAGVVPVPKHFPGHGSVATDSHVELPVQSAPLAQLRGSDLKPFTHLAQAGSPAVMVGHIVLADVDRDLPATLSPEVTTGLLREDLGFRGLVVTDALNMGAIAGAHGPGAAAVLALQAGADVLLMPADVGAAIEAVVAAVSSGELTRERLERSAAQLVATLRHVTGAPGGPADAGRGTDGRGGDTGQPEVLGSHGDLARELADASITQLSGPCGERLVGDAVSVVGGTAADRRRFAHAAQRQGLATGAGDTVLLLGGGTYRAGDGSGSGAGAGSGDVVVALDVPYGLADSTAGTATIATFGRTQATFDALVAVLTGQQPAPGTLPVTVGDHDRGAGCRP